MFFIVTEILFLIYFPYISKIIFIIKLILYNLKEITLNKILDLLITQNLIR